MVVLYRDVVTNHRIAATPQASKQKCHTGSGQKRRENAADRALRFSWRHVTIALVYPWMTFHTESGKQVIAGIAQEIIDRLQAEGASPGHESRYRRFRQHDYAV
jgi:hypothetical protein